VIEAGCKRKIGFGGIFNSFVIKTIKQIDIFLWANIKIIRAEIFEAVFLIFL
jgi:hypothetical protein